MLLLFHSCDKPLVTAVYYAGGDDITEIFLEDWNIAGPFTLTEDSAAFSVDKENISEKYFIIRGQSFLCCMKEDWPL